MTWRVCAVWTGRLFSLQREKVPKCQQKEDPNRIRDPVSRFHFWGYLALLDVEASLAVCLCCRLLPPLVLVSLRHHFDPSSQPGELPHGSPPPPLEGGAWVSGHRQAPTPAPPRPPRAPLGPGGWGEAGGFFLQSLNPCQSRSRTRGCVFAPTACGLACTSASPRNTWCRSPIWGL